jgi:hypothetical protein
MSFLFFGLFVSETAKLPILLPNETLQGIISVIPDKQ